MKKNPVVRDLKQNTSQVLTRPVESGRAVAPASAGPVATPPKLGNENVDAAAELAEMRDDD